MEHGDRLVSRSTRRAGRAVGTGRAWGIAAWTAAAAIPLAFLAVFFLLPVVSLIATGFTTEGRFDASGIPAVLGEPRTWNVVGQTLAQAALGTLLSLVLGVPAAFVLYRLRFRGRAALRGLMTVPFVLPTVVVGVAFESVFGEGGPLAALGLDRTLLVVVLALAFFNVTVVARTVGGFWSQLDPRPEQAARMLGAGPVRVWWTVTLPQIAPALASAASLVFLFCATSFGIVLILGGRSLSNVETEIYRLTVQFLDLRSAAVLSLLQFALVAVVLVVSARLRRRREQTVSLRPTAERIRRAHAPVIAVLAATVLLLHLLPMIALLVGSLRGRTAGADGAAEWTLQNYTNLFMPPADSPIDGSVADALATSLGIAALAATIALLLGGLVALVASRRPRSRVLARGIEWFDGAIMLPLGVSAVTLGFGLLLTMNRPLGIGLDLRTSTVLIPIAQALVALPIVVRTLLPVLRGIDPRQRDAAAMLGAGPLRVLGTIDLPLLGRSAGLAAGFALAASLGEFGATSFLVRPDTQTLPVVIAQLIGRQGSDSYGTALAGAVVLGAITAGIMLLAERWRGEAAAEW